MDSTNYDNAGDDVDLFHTMFDCQSSQWGSIDVITSESTSDCWVPSIAIDSSDNLHVTWSDTTDYNDAGTDSDIFYKMWNSTSSSWGNIKVISDTYHSGPSDHPSIAVDSTDTVHVVWKDYFLKSVIAYRYLDPTGLSWSGVYTVPTENGPKYNPSLAIDSSDNLHVVWPENSDNLGSGDDADIFYIQWNSSASVWSTSEVVSTESTSDCWSSTLTTDSLGNVHVVWKDYTNFSEAQSPYWSIAYKRWNSSNFSWSTTEVVNTGSTRYSDRPRIVSDSENNLHVVWHEYGYISSEDILYSQWNSSSSTWTPSIVTTTETSYSVSPALTIDSTDVIHMAWGDFVSFGADMDIFYKKCVKDSDGDTLPDKWEEDNGLNPNQDDSEEDPDADGLTNLEEYRYRTNPQAEDSDADGFNDKQEIDAGTDPLDSTDFPEITTTVDIILPLMSILVMLRVCFKRKRKLVS